MAARARIYDLAHWLWLRAQGENRLALLAASPFGEGEVEVVRWPCSVPAFVMLLLRHQPTAVGSDRMCNALRRT